MSPQQASPSSYSPFMWDAVKEEKDQEKASEEVFGSRAGTDAPYQWTT